MLFVLYLWQGPRYDNLTLFRLQIYTDETLPFREGEFTAEEKKAEIKRNNALKKGLYV